MTQTAIRCRNLVKHFGDVHAVDGVDFDLATGQSLALLGPSGCGKTTILRLIAGFERPDAGTIEIGGQLVSGSGCFMLPEQRRVGMVFQDYALFPHLDVADNVAYGIDDRSVREARVREVLALVGLAGLENRMPDELSGGQQQRVALARALAPRPSVILLDEPFSNLDAGLRNQLRGEVRRILLEAGVTSVFVTHDQEEALFMGDYVAILNAGRLEQIGRPEEVFHAPATRFVAEFLRPHCFLPARVTAAGLETPLGFQPQPLPVPPGASVDVLVRPDDVSLKPDPDGEARIADCIFRGMDYLYHVILPSGDTIQCLGPHTARYEPGTPVRVELAPGHKLTWFRNGDRSK